MLIFKASVTLLFAKWGKIVLSSSILIIVVGCNESNDCQTAPGNIGAKSNTGKSREIKVNSDIRPNLRSLQRAILDSSASPEVHAENVRKMSNWLLALPIDELVTLIESLDPKNNKQDACLLFEAIHNLGKRDPSVALSTASTMPPGFVSSFFFEILVKSDPDAVAKWISQKGMVDSAHTALALESARTLAHVCPSAALDVLKNGGDEVVNRMLGAILSEIAKDDPMRALQAAKNLPTGQRDEALRSVLRGQSVDDPSGAFDELAKLKNPEIASGTYPSIFRAWFALDPFGASRALADIPGPDIQNVLSGNSGQLSKLISNDLDLAITTLNKLVFTESNSSLFLNAARELAQKDPTKAMAWLQEFPDSPKKGDLLREVALARAATDPANVVPSILRENSDYRPQVIDGLATSWGRVDAGKALAYTNSLSAGEQAPYAATVLHASLQSNPVGTVKIITDSKLPATVRGSNEYKDAVRSVAVDYAARNLQEAVKWSTSLPNGDSEAAVSGVATQWAKRDPGATGEWILQLPEGATRNAAIQALVSQIEKTDPDAANQWKRNIR